MTTRIVKLQNQGQGQFNGGAILENKPIGFPQDRGEVKPYSNLFYWAHAWTPGERSLIGEHPHQGFEIMSFVLKGSIEHYDSNLQGWKKLEEGDAQIIRSGNGITHAELVNKESEFFQIWLDPNLDKTLGQPASYDDYKSDAFPVTKQNGITIKTYKGDGAPMTMDSPGVEIKEYTIEPGNHEITASKDRIYSGYMIEGNMVVDGENLEPKDYFIISDAASIKMEVSDKSRVFMISTPTDLGYATYAERFRSHWN